MATNEEMRPSLAAHLAPQAGDRLLDIGSGIGGAARWMAARRAGWFVAGEHHH
jgi:precorrin-6B methylase 2